MIKALKAMLGGGAKRPARQECSPREAAAALLIETAMVDHLFDDAEASRIVQALCGAFGCEKSDAESLVLKGEELVKTAVDHYRFTKVVKEQLPLEQREALVEELWSVALADGVNTADEDAFIRRICPLLAVDDRVRILARQRAEAKRAGAAR